MQPESDHDADKTDRHAEPLPYAVGGAHQRPPNEQHQRTGARDNRRLPGGDPPHAVGRESHYPDGLEQSKHHDLRPSLCSSGLRFFGTEQGKHSPGKQEADPHEHEGRRMHHPQLGNGIGRPHQEGRQQQQTCIFVNIHVVHPPRCHSCLYCKGALRLCIMIGKDT
ncbi:hypothetical protein D3C76_1356690 [compost metagenome]